MSQIRSIWIGVGAWAALACGSGAQTASADTSQPQTLVEIDPAINVCPVFTQSLIIPLDIAPSIFAQLAVQATDPDGNDATLVYDWSAPSGSFSNPDQPVTTYHCSALGPQVLSVSAEDVHGCRGLLALKVDCIAE